MFVKKENFIFSVDDFGISAKANQNILKLVRAGKIDRVSVMSHGVFSKEEIDQLLATSVKLDLHVDLRNDINPKRKLAEGTIKRGLFFGLNYFLGKTNVKFVEKQWESQIDSFRKMFGVTPDGINSHEHVHFFSSYFEVIVRLSKKYGIRHVRFGKESNKERGLTNFILRWFRKRNYQMFMKSNLESSDFMVSFDWIKDLKNISNYSSDKKVEIVFHPERDEEMKFLENVNKNKEGESIIKFQNELIPIIGEMFRNKEISFATVEARSVEGGNFWEPIEKIEGKYLWEMFDNNIEWSIEISKKIENDYQKVINKYFELNPKIREDILRDGENWLGDKLLAWSKPIIREGLIGRQEIEKIKKDFKEVIKQKDKNFWGYFHGNIIGDHIYIGEDGINYLLGLNIVYRPGKGYYDFLRSLDWILLKVDNTNVNFECTVAWMKKYLGKFDWEEIKLVFALRCIGILGQDMLNQEDLGKGDRVLKKEILLKFVRREY